MNKCHVPMEFTKMEKPKVIEYLKLYKHSPMAIKALLCAYHGRFHHSGCFISLESFLTISIQSCHGSMRWKLDERLVEAWNLDKQWKKVFFGFDRDKVVNGTVSDVESMVTEVHSNYIKRRNDIQTFTYRAE